MSKTVVVWDERYLKHEAGGLLHPERPERLLAIQTVLDSKPVGKKVSRLMSRFATVEEIGSIHDPEYIQKIRETANHRVALDPDTTASPATWDAARLAVGGVLNCVDAVFDGRALNAFAFVRPPGHHAERGKAMGFCIFNNVAIAAEYAIRQKGCRRVAIIDHDVHHGNGTQSAFYDRDDVFYLSTHRDPFYPGTGARSEKGNGKGEGYTLNVTLSGRQGDEEHLLALNQEILPAVEAYRPDLILVSAGYDSHRLDPLGGMNVTGDGFAQMTRRIVEVAKKVCGGRMALVLEGGYSLEGLAESVEKCLEVLVEEGC